MGFWKHTYSSWKCESSKTSKTFYVLFTLMEKILEKKKCLDMTVKEVYELWDCLLLPVLGEWCDGSLRIGPANLQLAAAPALKFVWDGILQSWCRQAQWIEEALRELRPNLLPRLQGVSLLARGRALGIVCVCVCVYACVCVSPVLLMNLLLLMIQVIFFVTKWAWRSSVELTMLLKHSPRVWLLSADIRR